MVRFRAADMTAEDRDALLEWLGQEGIDPKVVKDDGRLSVHNGRISWNEFILRENGLRVPGVSVPMRKPQNNPLPERFVL